MKFFVDTADTAEIADLAATGLLDGVTTNPSLIAKSGRKFLDVIAEICALTPGPVSAEVTALDAPTMLKEAAVLRAVAPNVTIKLPLTWDGLKACRALADDGDFAVTLMLIDRVLGEYGRDKFVAGWLLARGLSWASQLFPHLEQQERLWLGNVWVVGLWWICLNILPKFCH